MELVLWLIAVCLFIAGVLCLFARDWLLAVIFFLLAIVIGPGGISIF